VFLRKKELLFFREGSPTAAGLGQRASDAFGRPRIRVAEVDCDGHDPTAPAEAGEMIVIARDNAPVARAGCPAPTTFAPPSRRFATLALAGDQRRRDPAMARRRTTVLMEFVVGAERGRRLDSP
jgi:hypothetical protein